MSLRHALIAAAMGFVLVSCRDGRAPLNEAIRESKHRPLRGRLSGLVWAPPPQATRSGGGSAQGNQPTRLRAVAAEVWRSSDDEELKAAAALVAGYADDAAQRLQAITSRGTASAAAWNDLAVAKLETSDGDIQVLCRALAATDRAIDIDPALPEALFNRAVIIDSLSLRDAALKAYAEYLRVDGSSSWAAEARERMREIERTGTKTTAWRDLLPALERAAAAGDPGPIRQAATAFPQEARVWTETDLLGTWGDRTLAGDRSAGVPLTIARVIGATLREANGDALPADAVAAIDAAAGGESSRPEQLARAHVSYRNGRVSYRNREVAVAIPQLREALRLFSASGDPMALMARYYLANASIDAGDREAARVAAGELARDAPPRYRALHAEIDWLDAIVSGFDGSYERSLQAFRRAAAAFDQLREQQFATEMRDRIAALLTILGRTDEAWQLRRTTFPAAGEAGNAKRLETTLLSAVTDALHEKQWDVAHSLLVLMVDLQGGNVRLHAEALVWKALAANKASMRRTAEADVQAARRAAALLRDAALREDVENELRLVEAMLIRDREPARSVVLLTEHLNSANRRGRTPRLFQVLLERSRDLRRLGRTAEAEADLRNAIDLVETRRASLGREELRDSFLGTSNTAYEELADLLDARGDTVGAIAAADRKRARVLSDRVDPDLSKPLDINVAQRLPVGTALLTYGIFADRLVIYALGPRGLERFPTTTTATTIEQRSGQFLAAIANGSEKEARTHGATLYHLLVAPALPALRGVDRLIVVPDGALQRIPFAALVQDDGTFLIERCSIRIAPSVRRCGGAATSPLDAAGAAALIVGNPRIDRNRFPDLPSLIGAETEAREISAMYRVALTMTGDAATKERVLQALPACDVAHIAAHAVVDRIDPVKARLLLGRGTRDDGTLSTSEIAGMHLDRVHCVVLAACRTAVAEGGYGDLRTLAAAFLAAGCGNVVGTLWNVDDSSTRKISIELHRALRAGMNPTQAARDAQLRMIRSGDAALRSPAAWASIQVYGCD